jgi:uncharacterized repeat protein (TIGR02543 family)
MRIAFSFLPAGVLHSFCAVLLLGFGACQTPTNSSGTSSQHKGNLTVVYDANGGTGAVPVDGNTYGSGSSVQVLGNTGNLTNSGYAFAGWTTNNTTSGASSSYPSGETLTMGSSSVTLYAVWIPNNLTFYAAGNSIALTGYTTAPTGSLTVPAGVTSIGFNAFSGCTGLTGVTLPSSVTGLVLGAFSFSGLTSVTLPASVTYIGANVFENCTALTSISVAAGNPNFASVNGVLFNAAETTLIEAPGAMSGNYSVPSGVTSIGDQAFFGTSLTGVTIPSSVTSIGNEAFIDCSDLTSVAIAAGVASIGDLAFGGCMSLATVTLPASVTSIGEGVFEACDSLTSISVASGNPDYTSVNGVLFNAAETTLIEAPGAISGNYSIPSGVTIIGGEAFQACSALASVTIPSSVNTIGEFAFDDCTFLTSLTVTSGVKSIGNYAFANTALTSITIPSSVTSIGDDAFYAIGLTDVTIPSSVTSIGEQAFEYCSHLSSVTMLAISPPSLPASSNAFSNDATALQIHVPSGSLSTYKAATGWSAYVAEIVSP